ncbi:MAG: thymidine phosphorylase [Ignavibacteriae bacterium]|nr:MAG: thymidine phosphorylase [Ignavibacteriota bacterium]
MKSVKELLASKRDGREWTPAEIEWFIDGVVHGTVSPAQAAAFLMASCIRGLSAVETAALTRAMARSGDAIAPSCVDRPMVDKHSTGGVSDSVSLLLTPLAVACGLAVPMISGRGLGHTGGTVDKLESVIGFRTMYDVADLQSLLEHSNMFMAGQSDRIAPADRILYGLRDVTGTVENVGLITASILSKKLAEGIQGLVMDVKVGRAAFMKDISEAHALAQSLKDVGEAAGLRMKVVFTHMDRPLGNAIGNWVEIAEAERALQDRTSASADLVEVTTELVAQMLLVGDLEHNIDRARERVVSVWDSGAAHSVFHDMISQQGGQWDASIQRHQLAPKKVVTATHDGIVDDLDAMTLTNAVIEAGGGRLRETDEIDPDAGIVLHVRQGSVVQAGMPIATVSSSNAANLERLATAVTRSLQTTTAPSQREPSMIIDVW